MERSEGSKEQKRCIACSPRSSGMFNEEANADSRTTYCSVHQDVLSPQQTFTRSPDQYVPLANLTRIMRSILPPHAKIADDAKETIQECVSEFICLVTAEANVRCHKEQRKTIYADDVLSAMGTLGFQNYKECLTYYLKRHRMQEMGRRHNASMPAFGRAMMNFAQSSTGKMLPHQSHFLPNVCETNASVDDGEDNLVDFREVPPMQP